MGREFGDLLEEVSGGRRLGELVAAMRTKGSRGGRGR